ncbi:tetratricopeptide repeat protein [Candidatus Oscillochloris fontis]|uniref:tetratricopeptide repeat protein n=1 Tax=Candidatus Oscillochloris fontis TaxID=2496868 RepID=UPI00101D30DB|nr:tetratricopeptide repeat protein [Candidatus Oscillochloris fontis]
MLVNFLNRREPTSSAADMTINETERVQIAHPDAYTSFITRDLPQQMTFLALFAVGQSAYAQKDYPTATQVIRHALDSVQEHIPSTDEADDRNFRAGVADAYFQLGWLYLVPGQDNAQAVHAYDQALILNPEDAAAYTNRGIARYDQGNLDGAIADYTQALALDPQYAAAYTNRGLIYKRRNEREAAIADFLKARDLFTNPAHKQYAIDRLKELGVE